MRLRNIILGLLVSLIVSQHALWAADIDDLLLERLVEKGVITREDASELRAKVAIETQEEIAKKKKFGVEGKTKIDLSGYLQAQYVADETIQKFDEFRVRRARVDFRGDLSANIGWRLQVDAVQPLKNVVESIKQDNTTKNVTSKNTKVVTRPIILDAYIDYRYFSYANLRIGQFKLPFGRENLESSPNMDTINRSQVTERLVPGRDIGSQGRDGYR